MCSDRWVRSSLDFCSGRIRRTNQLRIRLKKGFQILAAVVTAAMLAACAQTSVVTDRNASLHVAQQTQSGVYRRTAVRAAHRRVATIRKKLARSKGRTGNHSRGVASYYEHDTQTASGEAFDPNKLTAAHPTLPFGTRVRVTNTTNGRSVTVRINDRGPFVQGRVVDVSSSAAEALRMTEQGVAKVKLDVLQ
jgi:peptidoglycan lytic transglycosylase